jgi:membrane-associated phospholipid phosphatase
MAIPQNKTLSRLLVKRTLFSLLIISVPLLAFVGIANEVKETEPLFGDIAVLQALHTLASPALDTLFLGITTLGSAVCVSLLTAAMLVYLYLHRHYRDALFVAGAVGGTVLLNVLFKLFFERARPTLWQQIIAEKGYSFPSGHAMISCSLALTIIILCWPTRWRRTAIILGSIYCIAVSISRLYLGVHYPSDVVGGWLVSIIWLYIIHRSFGIFSPSRLKETEAQPIEASAVTPAQKQSE